MPRKNRQKKAGSVINVDMNGPTVVSGDIFNSIKGKDITITFDIYTVRDYQRLNASGYGTLTGIEKYSQEEFDEHTHMDNLYRF